MRFVTIGFLKILGLNTLQEHVCNGCHDLLSIMADSLKNIAILSAKKTTFICLLMGISKNEALKKIR